MTLARVPWIGARQWGRDSSDAHATSRNTQIREPSEAELLPAGIDPTRMKERMTLTQFHSPLTLARVYWWYNTVGTHSRVAHAVDSANLTQVSPKLTTVTRYPEREPGYYQYEVSGLSQLHVPITQGKG